ncbi:MAG: DUF3574 domain-containing protein [Planctomycetaceae bacterium]|nr:DUF3574 domain-containing protein [Planctomycetaceae bacterium]MCP4462138.1 DUF3574 domain-containing protein [Planctomycetaceae bacterium]MDG1809873.1 DUF3574 domain-containing protein [Pirellulaceae bacterium]MDG1809881.1 DUF3574 domain-containing protein [Pirellulaceae bacterium]MDG2105145.1 DUF3574 domain-containing protein [Pirellulaceae bacterium]
MTAEKKVGDWIETTIYFGMDIPGGGVISAAQFDEFLKETVTKEFPMGLTAYPAYGQMRNADGSIERQKTEVVVLVHEQTKANREAVKKVVDAYRSEFGKPQVMQTTSAVDVAFFQSAEA